MGFYKKVLSILFFSRMAFAGGMPVVDTNELLKQISDGLFLTSSLDALISESGMKGSDSGAIKSLESELGLYRQEIQNYQALNGAVDDATNFPVERSKVFARQIRNVTEHIGKVRRVITLATSMAARPAAISASMAMLREQQEEDRKRTQAALQILEEKERVRLMRLKLQRKALLSSSIRSEIADIRRFSGDKTVSPVIIKSSDARTKRPSLW